MKVSKLMHTGVVTCRTADNLARAAELMWNNDIGCLPVIDEAGHVAGMITDRDICMSAYTRGTTLAAIPVTVAMATHVVACLPSDDLRDVEQVMSRHQVRRLPVIDEQNRPVGVISLNDIARASGKGSVPATEIASTLAGICAPREMIVSA